MASDIVRAATLEPCSVSALGVDSTAWPSAVLSSMNA
jgi:hypothetical protein